MICHCDESFTRRYFPEKCRTARDLHHRQTIPVTLGFQKDVCDRCRGLPEKDLPLLRINGRESKLQRYGWREIAFETIRMFEDWSRQNGFSVWQEALQGHPDIYRKFEIKAADKLQPLYRKKFRRTQGGSGSNTGRWNVSVDTRTIDSECAGACRRRLDPSGGKKKPAPAEIVHRCLVKSGFKVLPTGNFPIYVIFGVFMGDLVQDPADPFTGIVSVGDRNAVDRLLPETPVSTRLPADFGLSAYYARRKGAIKAYLKALPDEQKRFLQTFSSGIDSSHPFRQVLWGHRRKDLETARSILTVVPPADIKRILHFLIQDYYRRCYGWPDFLAYRGEKYFFAGTTVAGSRVRGDQTAWIRHNQMNLNLPFRIYEIDIKVFDS